MPTLLRSAMAGARIQRPIVGGPLVSRAAFSGMSAGTHNVSDVAKAAQAEAAANFGLDLTPEEAAQLAKVALAFARAKLQPQFVPTRINYSAAVEVRKIFDY
jgi:hypothetical protein